MRPALLVLAVLAFPLALATSEADERGDVLATHHVSSIAIGGSPYADCDHDAADILSLSAASSAGLFETQLLVADREAQPSCPGPVAATDDSRIFVLRLDRKGGSSAVASMEATWRETNGVLSGVSSMRFDDNKMGTCQGGGIVAVGDAVTFSCPLEGTATLTRGGTRAYDIRDAQWDATALTRHDFGSPATFVHFVDTIGPSRVTS